MMLDIVLPALPGGAARVLRWLADAGATLEAGAPLLIVRTDMVEAALPAPAAGRLGEIAVTAGQVAEPGQALGRIRPSDQPEERPPQRATPLARSIAGAHDIDLGALSGSGADGRVLAADVHQCVEAQRPLAAAAPQHVPVSSAAVEFDAGPALALCAAQEQEFARRGLSINLEACVASVVAELLPHHRSLNAIWGADGLRLRRRLHLAVAWGKPAGLAWSLVRDAGDLTLRGLARAMDTRADAGALTEATFALVSLAGGATWQSAPPLSAGMAASLGLGAPRRRPVACDGRLAIRPIGTLSLSYDARALDHAQAIAFLRALQDRLESL